jgi:hypothetical protein
MNPENHGTIRAQEIGLEVQSVLNSHNVVEVTVYTDFLKRVVNAGAAPAPILAAAKEGLHRLNQHLDDLVQMREKHDGYVKSIAPSKRTGPALKLVSNGHGGC